MKIDFGLVSDHGSIALGSPYNDNTIGFITWTFKYGYPSVVNARRTSDKKPVFLGHFDTEEDVILYKGRDVSLNHEAYEGEYPYDRLDEDALSSRAETIWDSLGNNRNDGRWYSNAESECAKQGDIDQPA